MRVPIRSGRNRRLKILGITATLMFTAGCASGTESQVSAASGTGFEYGASQDEVNTVLEELEPVTLTYQGGAPSESSPLALPALQFKEYIEERSNGQISIDVVWAGTIASYGEVDDALVDGRLDLAYTIPPYDVSEYPVYDATTVLSVYGPPSPIAGEAVTHAMMTALSFENEAFLSEFEQKGLTPLTPSYLTGTYGFWCNSENVEAEDWGGMTISAPTSALTDIVTTLGSTPVALEYTELFEGLERNTVQCATANASSASTSGLVEAAPNHTFSTSGGAARIASANVAGASFETLPLAYQQIIFDAGSAFSEGMLQGFTKATVDNIEVSTEAGGSFTPFGRSAQQKIDEAQQQLVEEAVANNEISADQISRAQELAEYWTSEAAAVGLEDRGSLEDFQEWYDPSEFNFEPFLELLYEDVLLEHRPGA